MKMLKKIILAVFILVLVLGLAAVIVAVASLDKIVKAGIETVAPPITQTTVTLDSASVSIFSGSVGLDGLVVGSPSGYKAPSVISIGKAAVSVQPGSLLADKIVVRSVEIRAPEITFEGNPLGDNNLKKLLDNVNASAGSGSAAASNAPASGAAKPGKKFEVDDLLLTGVKVHAIINGIVSKDFTLTIPDIHLTDLGKDSDGITAADLTKKILSQITTNTIKAVGDYAKTLVGGAAGDIFKNGTSNAGKAVDDGAAKIKKGLGGLLGK
jgi:hypothetical protein